MKSPAPASKYFLYARKSTDDEERQLLSIPAQIDELREFAQKENLNVIDTFIESKTAKVPGRELFNQMLVRVEAGEVQGILAWHPDRLAYLGRADKRSCPSQQHYGQVYPDAMPKCQKLHHFQYGQSFH